MDKLLSPFKQSKKLNTIFLSTIFFALHTSLIIYINSSFLLTFFSQTQVSSLYVISAIISMIALINISKVIEKVGNYKATMYALAIEFISIIGLLVSTNRVLIGLYFITHVAIALIIYFNFDIFLEEFTQDESVTGGVRATYMTVINTSLAISPLIASFLVIGNSYTYIYALSLILVIPLHYLLRKYKDEKIHDVGHIKIKETVAEYIKNKDLFNTFMISTIFYIFISFFVIYMPIYLFQHIGFSWKEIGLMLFIMLLPYIVFEIPVGELEDSGWSEKEFMTIGFVIAGLSTLFISFITAKILWIWIIVLLISNFGASLVEVSYTSYFFRKVNQQKVGIISFFRIARPLSYIIVPIVSTISLQFLPFQYLFIVMGIIIIMGVKYSMELSDVR